MSEAWTPDLVDTFIRAREDIVSIQRLSISHEQRADALLDIYDVPASHRIAVLAAMVDVLASGKDG